MTNHRIYGYDIARALAIFGMFIVNFKTVMHISNDGRDDLWWLSIFNVLDGRASAVFVILAGVGITLLTQEARLSENIFQLEKERRVLFKRAIFLFAVGILYIEIWPADILHYYGIYIAIGAFLLTASIRKLLWVGSCIAAGFPVIFSILDYAASWNWETLSYAELWSLNGFLRNLFFNGFHPVFPWAAFLIVGMALGRLPMKKVSVCRRVFLYGLIATLVIEAIAFGIRAALTNRGYAPELIYYLFSTTPMPPLPLYFFSAVGSSCAVIAFAVHIGEKYRDSVWLRPLIYVGQMSFTLYIAHVIVGMGLLEAFGLLSNQSLLMAVGCALIFCVGAIIFACYWRGRFKLGPLEWLMRKVTTTL